MTDVQGRHGDRTSASRPPKQEQERASAEVTEVAPGVLRMQLPIMMPGLGHVNCYGLVDARGLAVVDPGLPGPSSWRALKQRLRSAGFAMRDVHTVVVTHSHPDHFGGAGRIAKTTGAQVVTHRAFTVWTVRARGARSYEEAVRAEREAAAAAALLDTGEAPPTIADDDPLRDDPTPEMQRQSVPWGGETPWGGSRHPRPTLARRMLIRALRTLWSPPDPSRRVVHEEPIVLGGREWRALHTPGHTLDHLCLYDPDHGVLLSGDHVLPSITPHISGSGHGDALRSYLATLDLVASLDGVRLGLPAHGHPFTDVPGRVEAITRHHEEREALLCAAASAIGRPATVTELSRELFPRRHWGVMAESETFAHLEHLRARGVVERVVTRDAPWRYVLVATP